MWPSLVEPITHTLLAVALIAAYTTLAALGHDQPVLLGILGGQIGSLGVSKVAGQVTAAAASQPTATLNPVTLPVETEPPPPAAQAPVA